MLFYYPNGCLTCENDYIIKSVDDLEACRDEADALRASRGNNQSDLFECGRDCELKGEKMYLCEETVD